MSIDIDGPADTTSCFKVRNVVFGIIRLPLGVSGMTAPDVRDENVSWIADQSQHPDELPDPPQLHLLSDQESNLVTFASNRPEDSTTAAWITVDADVLVDVSEAN